MVPRKTDREPAAVRAFWSGTISFGLVSIPVDLFAAVRARSTSMKMVDAKGRSLGRQYYCPKDGKKLSMDDIVRGYETQAGKLVTVSDQELEAVAPEKSRDIDLRRFVPLDQIPPTYYQRPYFLAPSGRSAKAYHLLAETMEKTKRVGIGTFVMRDHEYLVAILSDGGLLRAETLRFAEELRSADDVGLPTPPKGTARRARHFQKLIDDLSRDALDLQEMSDWYADEIRALVERKLASGKDVVETEAAADEDEEQVGGEVVDLMKVLRQRLSQKATVKQALQAQPPARQPLDELSKEELYERAKVLDIAGRSHMSKKKLVQALRKAA